MRAVELPRTVDAEKWTVERVSTAFVFAAERWPAAAGIRDGKVVSRAPGGRAYEADGARQSASTIE